MRYLYLLLFLLSISHVAGGETDSSNTVVLREPLPARYLVTKEIERLDDPSGRLGFQDVYLNKQFIHNGSIIHPKNGYCGWWRISFRNDTRDAAFYLMRFGWLDTIEIYEPGQGRISRYQYGILFPYRSKLIRDMYNIFPLLIQPGETRTFYMNIKTDDHFSTLTPSVALQNEFVYRAHWYFYGCFLGVSLLLIFLCLGLAIIFHDMKYTILALPIIGMLLWFGNYNGDLLVMLHIPPVCGKYGNFWLTGWLAPVSGILFAAFYVDLRMRMAWAYYSILFLALAVIVLTFGALFHKSSAVYANYVILAAILLCVCVTTILAFKGHRSAKIYLLFVTPFLIPAFYMLLILSNVASTKIDIVLLTQIGCFISSLIISYELYYRVKATVRERLQVLRENKRLVEEQNLILEEKVTERTHELQERSQQLAAEKKKSDDLLLNILPAEVAEELKDRGTAAAKQFDEVTVLFTDFVDFTVAGGHMDPQQLVDELHECFKAFDGITSRYGIEKIKTIGDAYLAVAGLPVADPRHACNVVAAAIDILQFMQHRKDLLGDKTFNVRIGIHSGSVVAGIVGVKKFAYDIWGDTVNTAARMEQHGEAGKINISEVTYQMIRQDYSCSYRGEVLAKNMGALKMYFVTTLPSIVKPLP